MTGHPMTGYEYVGVPMPRRGAPYSGRIHARFIEEAYKGLMKIIPQWRPGLYQVFLYCPATDHVEYQPISVAVEADGTPLAVPGPVARHAIGEES